MTRSSRPLLTTNEKHEIAIQQMCQELLGNKYIVNIIWILALEYEMTIDNQTTILTRKSFYRFKAIQYCKDLEHALRHLCNENEAYKEKFHTRDLRGAGIIQKGNEILYDLSQQTPIMTDLHKTYLPDRIQMHIDDGECFNLHVGFTFTGIEAAKMRNALSLDDFVQFPVIDYPNIKLFYKREYFRHEYNWNVVSLIDDEPLFFAETYP